MKTEAEMKASARPGVVQVIYPDAQKRETEQAEAMGKFVSNAAVIQIRQRPRALRVAAYIRVSTDMSDQENSYEAQERYFEQLISGNPGWISGGIYSDYGISGTSREGRTGFQRLLRHCSEGKIDRVVCKSISRMCRNTADFLTALEVFRNHGVTVLFEKENLDSAKPVNEFVITTLAAIAQEESRNISDNIRWSYDRRYPFGEACNKEIYGYRYADDGQSYETTENGYRFRRLVIAENEAAVVRRIFLEAAAGKSFAAIARALNAEKIPAPKSGWSRRSKRQKAGLAAKKGELRYDIEQGWTAKYISRIVRNERYAGDARLQKTCTVNYLSHERKKNEGELPQYLVKDHHPAIISRELYEQVMKICEKNSAMMSSAGSGRIRYPFSGRLICAYCGRFLNVKQAATLHPKWFCPTAELRNGMQACTAESVYEEQLYRVLRQALSVRCLQFLNNTADGSGKNGADLKYGHDRDAYGPEWRFIRELQIKMQEIQSGDYMERDRSFMKRQVLVLQSGMEHSRRRIRLYSSVRESLLAKKGIADVAESDIKAAEEELQRELDSYEEMEAEAKDISQKLEHLESYCAELDEDYGCREAALCWMRDLLGRKDGITEFLNGVEGKYLKAFVLSVRVYSPLQFTVRWFDRIDTEVRMHSNYEDFRRMHFGCLGAEGY